MNTFEAFAFELFSEALKNMPYISKICSPKNNWHIQHESYTFLMHTASGFFFCRFNVPPSFPKNVSVGFICFVNVFARTCVFKS